jgi:hypothetical protein
MECFVKTFHRNLPFVLCAKLPIRKASRARNTIQIMSYSSITLLAYHADNGLFVCSSESVMNSLVKSMSRKYTLKVSINPSRFLKINVEYDCLNRCLLLDQSA